MNGQPLIVVSGLRVGGSLLYQARLASRQIDLGAWIDWFVGVSRAGVSALTKR